jgi:hypothetical protein
MELKGCLAVILFDWRDSFCALLRICVETMAALLYSCLSPVCFQGIAKNGTSHSCLWALMLFAAAMIPIRPRRQSGDLAKDLVKRSKAAEANGKTDFGDLLAAACQ